MALSDALEFHFILLGQALMSGGPTLCFQRIKKRLTRWEHLVHRTTTLAPDFLSQAFPYESDAPIAAVCLTDCIRTLGAARYALDRYCEVGAGHRARGAEMEATFFEVFYLDDVVLRLYSSAEHLANAIIMMRGITDAELQPYQRTPSQWERLRKQLNTSRPAQDLTAAFASLRKSVAWRFAMKYRGRWVHNQPPAVAGLGITYRRERQWRRSQDGRSYSLVVRNGDPPEHRTDEMGELCLQAFVDFLEVLQHVVDEYFRLLAEHGIQETPEGIQYTMSARSGPA